MQKTSMLNTPKRNTLITFAALMAASLAVSGCQLADSLSGKSAMSTSGTGLSTLEQSQATSLASVAEVFDAGADEIPTLTAVGYAVVSSQPGRSDAQKRLMAIRSARMVAMRDLAEQIHGLQVDSSTTVIDLMVQNDTFRGVVSGTIRGARTVRINPTGSDTYEIVLEIDRDMIAHLMGSARSVG